MKIYKFNAEIKKHEGKDATYIEVPIDVEKEFGCKREATVYTLIFAIVCNIEWGEQ